jgi:Fe-S-cluster containining protein
VADALLVRQAVSRLSDDAQSEVRRQAMALAEKFSAMEPGWKFEEGLAGISEESFDGICEALADEPCPLLDREGECRIYDDRPMICRMTGLGIVSPAGRVIENNCPIAADFPAYAALSPQPLELEALEEIEDACLEAAALALFGTPDHARLETTIAIALATQVSLPAQRKNTIPIAPAR